MTVILLKLVLSNTSVIECYMLYYSSYIALPILLVKLLLATYCRTKPEMQCSKNLMTIILFVTVRERLLQSVGSYLVSYGMIISIIIIFAQ